MTPSSRYDLAPTVRLPAAWRSPLLAVLVVLGGCKLVDEGLNNEQLKEFREQGQAAGSGLNVPEVPKIGLGDNQAAAPDVDRSPKTGGALVEEIVAKRVRCGTDAACAREQLDELRALGHAAEQPMIGILAENHPTELRLEAIRTLAFLRVTSAIAAIGRLVNDQRPDVQREAVWALGQIRDVRAVEILSRVLTSSTRLELRDTAAQALGSLRDPEAAEALIAAWRGAESRTRAPIVSALGQIGDSAATDVLIEALTMRDDVTRLEAVNGLEAVGALEPRAKKSARAALEALAADPETSELVRRRARTVLGLTDGAPSVDDTSPLDDVPDHAEKP